MPFFPLQANAGYIMLVILCMFSHAPFFPIWLWTHDFKKENWFNLISWSGNNYHTLRF